MSSMQHKFIHDNKPRVHITYDVETDQGTEQRELPFVVGVIGDFAGNSEIARVPLAQREFVNIDNDNFDQVMQSIAPSCQLRVTNHVTQEGGELPISLTFQAMKDFEPENIAQQIPALKKLILIRDRLRELLNKADSSVELELFLENSLNDPKQLLALQQVLGLDKTEAAA